MQVGKFECYLVQVGSGYVDDLVDNYPSPVKHYDQVANLDGDGDGDGGNQVEEPLPVYRRALANAEDGTVAIASVIFPYIFIGPRCTWGPIYGSKSL